MDQYGVIRTRPGVTKDGKPFDWYVQERVGRGELTLEEIPAAVAGTPRNMEVYRAMRKGNLIVDWQNKASDREYCAECWADLRIGTGPCGYWCAECFLILTHRVKADPSRHILYSNVSDFVGAAKKWLLSSTPKTSLGVGIDCSDSLLYEGVTGYARSLIPLFAAEKTNPHGRKLVLLTKSANVRYLEGLPTQDTVVSFSLNPQAVADVFEGKYPDGLRVTPAIQERLAASGLAAGLGFETRWRIDPIVPIEGWEDCYREFFLQASHLRPSRITLGIYRRMGSSLGQLRGAGVLRR
jgi:DNA repair photolyase